MTEDYKDTRFLNAFGDVIKRYREQNGVTQMVLAKLSGLHRTYVSDVDRGLRNLTVSSALRIAQGLNVPTSVLIAETEKVLGGK